MTCDGNFSQNARDCIFLNWQPFEGLQITVYSACECMKYLLNSGLKIALTEKFNQDVVEMSLQLMLSLQLVTHEGYTSQNEKHHGM